MPLVVPGLMSSSGSNNNGQEDWMNKLVGKKLTDNTSDNTVRGVVDSLDQRAERACVRRWR